MSADDTVLVLKTKGKHGALEYRVAHVQAVENLTDGADYPKAGPQLNRRWALDAFRGAKAFADQAEALKEATRIDRAWGGTEYGIRLLDLSRLHFPSTDRKLRARRWMRRAFGRRTVH